jgi:phage repressor protein C with HTH and peptisase S24 domain
MLPTLQPGRVIIGVRARRIRRGDVVIVAHDGLEKVKRVKYSRHGKVFLVGDKPDRSTDSRSFGAIGEDAIVAKVIWPRIKAR